MRVPETLGQRQLRFSVPMWVLAGEVYLSKDRFAAKLKVLRHFLWKNLSADLRQPMTRSSGSGGIDYHGISDNKRRVWQVQLSEPRGICRWFNLKGGRPPPFVREISSVPKDAELPVTSGYIADCCCH